MGSDINISSQIEQPIMQLPHVNISYSKAFAILTEKIIFDLKHAIFTVEVIFVLYEIVKICFTCHDIYQICKAFTRK